MALLPLFTIGTAKAADPNALDTTCGGTGLVQENLAANLEISYATLIQPDGKILSVGHANGTWDNGDMVVIRYTTACVRDNTFGNNGLVIVDASGRGMADEARAALLQPDGKIVLAGRRTGGSNDDAAVVRLTPDGALDPTWDGDGIAVLDFGGNELATGVVRQTDGKIAISGQTNVNGSSLLARFNSNGSLDNTFNGSGSRVYQHNPQEYASFTGIAVQPDGKLVASGYVYNEGFESVAVRVTANGTPDLSFADSGLFRDSGGPGQFNAVATRPDGRILLAGYSAASVGANRDFSLRQLTALGALDGYTTADLANDNDFAYAIALQQDGGVVLAGSSSGRASIVVFGANLERLYSSSAGQTVALGVAVAADGTIVAGGYVSAEGAYDLQLARWAGSPVMRFATAGSTVRENVGTAGVVVTRKGTLNAVTMDYATSDGTALAGSDYTPKTGTVSFAAGVATQTIPVAITNDTRLEGAETFNVTLSTPGPRPWSVTLVPPTTTTITINPSDQRVDGLIKPNGGTNVGNNIYNTTGVSQTVTQNASRGQKKIYYATAQNDGNAPNTLLVKGSASSTGYAVSYFAGTSTTNISYAITHAGYSTGSLAVGASKLIRVEITASSTAPHGSTKSAAITSTWTGDMTTVDVVKANLHTT